MTSPLKEELMPQWSNNEISATVNTAYRGSLFRFWNPVGSFLPKYTLFDPVEMGDFNLYRACFVEFLGTFFFTNLHFGINGSSVRATYTLSAIGHTFAYWLLLITFGPISGGHFNPLITISTVGTGKTTISRAVLYFGCQCIGGFFAALCYGAMFEDSVKGETAECGYLADEKGAGEYVLFVSIQNLLFLFFVYALAFDSRASSLLGPLMAPLVLAIGYGLLVFACLSSVYYSTDDYGRDDSTVYGYRWSNNLAFCIASKYYYDTYSDDDGGSFEDGTGYAFLCILITVLIHSLLYLFLLPAVPHYEQGEEENGRNKKRLHVEII